MLRFLQPSNRFLFWKTQACFYGIAFLFTSLIAQSAPLWDVSFSEEEILSKWKAKLGQMQWISKEDATSTQKILIWKAAQGSEIGTTHVPQNWQKGAILSFWIRQTDIQQSTLEVHLKESSRKLFWRRITLNETQWQQIELPLYSFARRNGPHWKNIQGFVFHARNAEEFQLRDLQLRPANQGVCGLVEPTEILLARAFPTPDMAKTFHSKHFRLLTNTTLEGEKILLHFEELLTRFQQTFSFSEAPELPLTFVIFQEKEEYLQFCSQTVQEVYGLQLSPTLSDGRTFFDYCSSSYSERFKEERPVYIHEMAHQLISKYLGFDLDQYWVQEGFASLFQRDLSKTPPSLNKAILKMIQQKNWVPLQKLDARYLPPTSEYLQMLTLVEFLLKGEFSAKWKDLSIEFQAGRSLKEVVQKILWLDLALFEQKWIDFCRTYYGK